MILKEVVKKEVNFLMKGFRMWVNSLGIEDLHINNLYEEFKDGLALLKIIDKVIGLEYAGGC